MSEREQRDHEKRTREKERIRIYRTYTSERKRAAGEPTREKERNTREKPREGGCAGEERWDTPRAERGRGRRKAAADGKARTCERDRRERVKRDGA